MMLFKDALEKYQNGKHFKEKNIGKKTKIP